MDTLEYRYELRLRYRPPTSSVGYYILEGYGLLEGNISAREVKVADRSWLGEKGVQQYPLHLFRLALDFKKKWHLIMANQCKEDSDSNSQRTIPHIARGGQPHPSVMALNRGPTKKSNDYAVEAGGLTTTIPARQVAVADKTWLDKAGVLLPPLDTFRLVLDMSNKYHLVKTHDIDIKKGTFLTKYSKLHLQPNPTWHTKRTYFRTRRSKDAEKHFRCERPSRLITVKVPSEHLKMFEAASRAP